MFEVGKQYKSKYTNLRIVEVLAATQTYVIIKFLKWEDDLDIVGQEKAWLQEVEYQWEEYTPPKVYTSELYVNLFQTDKELYTTHRKYENADEVGRIRVTFTEGQGLAVEVLS